MRTQQVISPKWVVQVLRDRGIKPPALLSIQRYLDGLDAAQLDATMASLRKIEFGVDDASLTEDLVMRLGQHAPAEISSTTAPPPTPVARAPISALKRTLKTTPVAAPWWRRCGAHIYAGKAAMKVELDLLHSEPEELARYTVQIEMAPASAPKSYDWDSKVIFQFTLRELPLLAAALLGYARKDLVLTNHGPERNKTFELVDQHVDHLFVKLRQGARVLAMPVMAGDAYAWLSVTMLALKHNQPDIDGALQLQMIRRVAALHDAPSRHS